MTGILIEHSSNLISISNEPIQFKVTKLCLFAQELNNPRTISECSWREWSIPRVLLSACMDTSTFTSKSSSVVVLIMKQTKIRVSGEWSFLDLSLPSCYHASALIIKLMLSLLLRTTLNIKLSSNLSGVRYLWLSFHIYPCNAKKAPYFACIWASARAPCTR